MGSSAPRGTLLHCLRVATVYFLDSSDRISRGSNTGERENILFTLFVCCHSKIEMIECLLGRRRPCQCPRPALSGFTKDSLKEHPAWSRFRMIIIHNSQMLVSTSKHAFEYWVRMDYRTVIEYCVGIWFSPVGFWRAGQPPLKKARLWIETISHHDMHIKFCTVSLDLFIMNALVWSTT